MSLLLASVVPVLEGAVTFFLEYMVLADDGLGVLTVAVLNVLLMFVWQGQQFGHAAPSSCSDFCCAAGDIAAMKMPGLCST